MSVYRGENEKILLSLFFSLLIIGAVFSEQSRSQTASPGFELKSSAVLINPADDMKLAGTYVYLLSRASGTMQIWDVSDVTAPIFKSIIKTQPAPSTVDVAGNYAYVVSGVSPNRQLKIFNIADPVKPAAIGSIAIPHPYSTSYADIQVIGNYAYTLLNVGNTFQIFDVSNPVTPIIKNSVKFSPIATSAYAIKIVGNYAYVLDRFYNRLATVDISEPSNPKLISFVSGVSGLSFDI